MAGGDRLRAKIAAANNADWYEANFRSRGLQQSRGPFFWASEAEPPPYHSNMVTLDPNAPDEQLAMIDALTARLARDWSLKDSFCTLDLTGRGFDIAFEAQWIWRSADRSATACQTGWSELQSPDRLAAWEDAWAENGSPRSGRAFHPALLNDPDLAFFGRWQDGHCRAGFIANRSQAAAGLSNFFSARTAESDLRDAITLVSGRFPGLALTGYEHGESLNRAIDAGFSTTGRLRIWHRQCPGQD